MDNTLNQAVILGTKDIFQSIIGDTVTVKEPIQTKINTQQYAISVVIGFAGDISGAFILKCDTALGVRAASAMLGMDVPADSPDMRDAIGEFFNMVVGKVKSSYSGDREAFKISVPTTIVGTDYIVYTKANDGDKVTSIDFIQSGYGFNVEIYLK